MALDTSEMFFWRFTFMDGLGASHCYLRGPSDSLTVVEHCDKKLETSPILFVNYIFGFLLLLRTLLVFQPMPKKESPKLVIPKHMAVVFTDDAHVYLSCLIDIIAHSVFYGIEKLTFFDPWCILESRKYEIIAELRKFFESRPNQRRILFNEESDGEATKALRVTILGSNDGRASLVRACKQLCHSTEEVSIASVYEKLATEHIQDPDFLLKVGNLNSLAGYPPWNLRITELLSISSFEVQNRVQDYEFLRFLQAYSSRDRRIGK
jgi:hypothetical protein